ncbi:MAG: CpaE family protein [Frankiaceae bacterium]
MTLIVDNDPTTAQTLQQALDPTAEIVLGIEAVRRHLDLHPDVDAIVAGPTVDADAAFRLAETLRIVRPTLGVVLIRRRVDTALLADALRAGVREVVADRDLAAAADALRRVLALARQMRERSGAPDPTDEKLGTLVTVFSAKGGCGKTTLATNLGAALADKGRREVCIVDLDLAFGDVAIALQLFPAHTLADTVTLGDAPDAQAVSALLTPHSPGLTTLVAPVEPGMAESIPAATVTAVLQVLKRMFDFVIVDTPPAFTDHVLAAFDQSDMVALIATLDIPALKNLKLTLETLDLLNYPRERSRVVLNRADSKVGLALSEVEKTLQTSITAQIPSSRDVPASINRGVPIVLDDPKHAVSVAVRRFAEQCAAAGAAVTAGAAVPAHLRTDRRSLRRRKARAS